MKLKNNLSNLLESNLLGDTRKDINKKIIIKE